MRKRSITALVVAGAIAVPTTVAWLYRTSLVTQYIDRALTQRGVQAQYEIVDIGLGTQRLTNVVLGDPASPDLIIRDLEIGIALQLDGPRIVTVRAEGVRLDGRLVNNRLTFGAVDRLIPADDGTPFSLPDIQLSLRKASARIETPWGRIGIGANGYGSLADGFEGRLAFRSARLAQRDCSADDVQGALRIEIISGRPSLAGPLGARQLACTAYDRADARHIRLLGQSSQ